MMQRLLNIHKKYCLVYWQQLQMQQQFVPPNPYLIAQGCHTQGFLCNRAKKNQHGTLAERSVHGMGPP